MNNWFHLLEDQNNNLRSLINSHNNIYSTIHRNNYQNMDLTFRFLDRLIELQTINNNTTTSTTNTNTNTDAYTNIFGTRNTFAFGREPRNTFFHQPRHNTRPFNWNTTGIFGRSTNNNNRSQQISRPFTNILNQTNLQPVIPSRLQIDTAVLSTKWREIKETTNQPLCPITQQSFEDDDDVLKINHCGHVFKKNSLLQWFQRSSLCPVCRFNIITRNFGTSTSSEQTAINTLSSITNEILTDLTNTIINRSINDISHNLILTTAIEYEEVNATNDVETSIDELLLPISPIHSHDDISDNHIITNDLSNNLLNT